MRAALVTAAALFVLVACSGEPAATEFAAQPDLIRIGDLEVQLVDPAGLTAAVLPVPDSMDGPFMRVGEVPGQPLDRVIPWTGGDCDAHTTLTVQRGGVGITVSIQSTRRQLPSGQLCTLGGRLLAVVVRFVDPPPAITVLGG